MVYGLRVLGHGTKNLVFIDSWVRKRVARFSILFLRPERKTFIHCHFWTVSKRAVFFFSQRGEFGFKMHIFRASGTPILTHVHRGHTKEMVILSGSRERANSARRGSEAHPEQRITARGRAKSPEVEEAQVEIWTTMRQEIMDIIYTKSVWIYP